MSFPRYPKYKDSGVEWLGEVPEHWEVKPLKHLAGVDSCGSYGVEPEGAEIVLPVATTAQIDASGRFAVEQMPNRGFVASDVQRFGCKSGDILIVKSSGSAANIISGKAGIVDESTPLFVFSNFLMRLSPIRDLVVPKFLYSQLRSHLTRQRVELMCSTTTYPNLQVGEYTSALLPVPPLVEQAAITEFLDWETRKIDELMAEQQRLMELLKEKRQAVISHAVTQGLNPRASMKTSGIEWLGDVPAHWEVTRLSRLAAEIGDGLHGTPEYVDESEFYFINGNNLVDGSILVTDTTGCVSQAEFARHRVGLDQSTVLLSINGTIGNLALYQGEAVMLGKSACYVNCTDRLVREFLFWHLQSSNMRRYFEFSVSGTTIFNLSLDSVRRLPVALPPCREQLEIVASLNAEVGHCDGLLQEAQKAIDLLQERRTALISAAVTGQIDVRKLAAA